MTETSDRGWTITTPIAPLSVVTHGEVVIASGFGELREIAGWVNVEVEPAEPTGTVADAVRAYLAGQLDALDDVEVRQPGGPFAQEAWRAMREIPPGQTWSYRDLATKASRPDAVRAAGTACGRNHVAPFVPCHRVVRSDGSLGGYAYGLGVKRWLLAHEGVTPGSNSTG
jgi:methylated-DNA-[protein]-cysteine S-methyltransferase